MLIFCLVLRENLNCENAEAKATHIPSWIAERDTDIIGDAELRLHILIIAKMHHFQK